MGWQVRRSYKLGVLTGSVTPFWSTLQRLLAEHPEIGSREMNLQVVRVELASDGGDGMAARIVGARWPTLLAEEVTKRLEAAAEGKAEVALPLETVAAVDRQALAAAQDDRLGQFEQ